MNVHLWWYKLANVNKFHQIKCTASFSENSQEKILETHSQTIFQFFVIRALLTKFLANSYFIRKFWPIFEHIRFQISSFWRTNKKEDQGVLFNKFHFQITCDKFLFETRYLTGFLNYPISRNSNLLKAWHTLNEMGNKSRRKSSGVVLFWTLVIGLSVRDFLTRKQTLSSNVCVRKFVEIVDSKSDCSLKIE